MAGRVTRLPPTLRWALELAEGRRDKKQGWVSFPPSLHWPSGVLCWAGDRGLATASSSTRESAHVHTHLTSVHRHMQHSSTPTLTPAGEEITSAIAESKQRRR